MSCCALIKKQPFKFAREIFNTGHNRLFMPIKNMKLTGVNAISYGKRLFIIDQYIKKVPKIQTQRNLRRHYRLEKKSPQIPHKRIIIRLIKIFETEGLIHDRRCTIRAKNKLKKTARTSELYDKIKAFGAMFERKRWSSISSSISKRWSSISSSISLPSY